MRVAIIGAGLAGLSAALRCQQLGLKVQLFDPNPVGGKARTVEPVPGWKIEWGPHSFTGRAQPLFDMARDLGLAPVPVCAVAGTRYLRRDGRLKKAGPLALRWGEGWELLRGLFRRVDHAPGESVATWVSRSFGPQMALGPVAAMLKGIWATSPEEVEMDAGFPMLAEAVSRHGTVFRALRNLGGATKGTFTLPGGLGALSTAAVAKVGAPMPSRVVRLSLDHNRWRVHTAGGSERFGAVIVATEAFEAARLLETIPELTDPESDPGSYSRLAASVEALGQVRYAPLMVAHWLSPDVAFPHGFGYLSADPGPLLGTIFVSDLLPDRAPPGKRSFATMIGGSLVPGAVSADEQQVRTWLTEEHRQLTGQPCNLELVLVRHARAVAPPSPGFSARMQVIGAGLPPRLVLAGSYLGAGAMPDAIAAGRAAANQIRSTLHAP